MDTAESMALLRDYSFYQKNFERHVANQNAFGPRVTPPGVCFHRDWNLDTLERAQELKDLRDRLDREAREFRFHI